MAQDLYTNKSLSDNEITNNGYNKVLVDAECTHDGSVKHIQKFEHWGWRIIQRRVLDAERTDDLHVLQLVTWYGKSICISCNFMESGKPLVIEVEVAPPKAGEVRLKILFTSLSHIDVYFWDAKGQTPLFPRIFGHEAAGVRSRRRCDSSATRRPCPPCVHRGVWQMHSFEYNVAYAGCVAKINPAAPFDKVYVLSCGICTGMGATVYVAKPKPGSSIAILGLGVVGLAAAEGATILAKKFGVNEFVNPKDHDKPIQQGWGLVVLVGVPSKDDAFKTAP
ncbi:hypothetical protein RJT34_16621 [Clitoria ternatea]|uniref:Alcohol dehydrogenase n=1 Tax=Clitoria ternatea TaxID=43366 RepID=A0AAN9PCG9_CLITE